MRQIITQKITQKTKDTLTMIVRDGLAVAFSRSTEPKPTGMTAKSVAAVSSILVDQLMHDRRFIDCMGTIVPAKMKEWLSTEDAARLSGFSRPFIIALLDGPLYSGKVTRTAKGHRRIARDEFASWLGNASLPKVLPKTIKDVRSGPRDEEPVMEEENDEQKSKRKAVKTKTMEYARSKGLL